MKKSNFILGLLIVLSFLSKVNAQEVKLKKDKVLIDDVAILDYNKKGDEISIYKLGTKSEIVYMMLNRNGTQGYQQEYDDYKKIVFIENNAIVESSTLKFESWKNIIQLLMDGKVINMDGTIDTDNLKKFVLKYDEKINPR